jgi:hypothetical protein
MIYLPVFKNLTSTPVEDFCDVTPCSAAVRYRRFGECCCPCLQGHWYLTAIPHVVTTQKTSSWIFTTLKTSNVVLNLCSPYVCMAWWLSTRATVPSIRDICIYRSFWHYNPSSVKSKVLACVRDTLLLPTTLHIIASLIIMIIKVHTGCDERLAFPLTHSLPTTTYAVKGSVLCQDQLWLRSLN